MCVGRRVGQVCSGTVCERECRKESFDPLSSVC